MVVRELPAISGIALLSAMITASLAGSDACCTNFLFGTISFVSNSVTIVLQLALSVDYAVIFLNRYKEEHASLPAREAVIIALSKAIPEIAGSSSATMLEAPKLSSCISSAFCTLFCSGGVTGAGLCGLRGE